MTNTYGANNGLLTKSTYGNGTYVENIYDRYDRVTRTQGDGSSVFMQAHSPSPVLLRGLPLGLISIPVASLS